MYLKASFGIISGKYMLERFRNYRKEGDERALYYWEYRETYERHTGELVVGQIIPAYLDVAYMGNNRLSAETFDLRNSDREAIGNFVYPGKSSHVAFTRDLTVACGAVFDRKAKRQDHLYIVPARLLMEMEFHPYYCPRYNLPLHVRLVHRDHIGDPSLWNTPHNARVRLADIFQRYQVA